MRDVVEELQHRAEQMEADFHRELEEREREHAGHGEREHAERHDREHEDVARAIDELRHTVERLNDEVAELRERLEDDDDDDREDEERDEEEREDEED
ncbi:hypothetical protein [Maioricimonas rarisocia]|nr:hypothetical protein [Maioricimonas rarisocia]